MFPTPIASDRPAPPQPGELTAPIVGASPMIVARGLTKQFIGGSGVFDIDLTVPRGGLFGFIGPSGCGKTTTVRLLTGIYEPSAGGVSVMGSHPLRFTQAQRTRIGYMPQHSVLSPDLTVWENLNFFTSVYGMNFRRKDRLMELLEFVELVEHRDKLVRQISGGMQRRVGLAATLVHSPDLLFLDEPTAGIDPVLRRKFWDHFKQLQSEGRTLFVTTQYVGEAVYCDLVGVMADGYLRVLDTPDGLRRRAQGGADAVDMTTETRLDAATLGQLLTVEGVKSISRVANTSLRIQVEDAATAIPEIVDWCREHQIEVTSVQQYVPPFDDVFVELMRQERSHEQQAA